ncbi:MAG: hypothetical protein KatS3mg123_1205 [Burkholderiales bacterium]|nr:MAG: hypothetical protein KatS3mg123_1205 [Burkholderiales bacterium]
MAETAKIIDLQGEPESRVRTAAFYALRDLARGERATVLTREEPTLVLEAVNLQLRGRLAWRVFPEGGAWRAEVGLKEDAPPQDAIDLLTRHHASLDRLFVRALERVNDGAVAEAAPLLASFAAGLRAHIAFEDGVLALRLAVPASPAGDDPLSIMLREHREILVQLALLEECLAQEPPDRAEVGAFCAILSGTLAKHEHREENHLFPLWRLGLDRLPPAERRRLLDDLLARLPWMEPPG